MKNKLLLFLVLVSLTVLPILSFAETSTSTVRKTIGDEIEARNIKASVQEIKQNAIDKIKAITNRFIQNVIERFDAGINRLEKLSGRINSRMVKMEANGTDITKAKELLAIANTKIEVAKTSIAAIAPDIESVATSTTISTSTLKEGLKIIKTQIAKAKEDIGVAHAALVDVVNSLKLGNNKLKNSNN
jgi:hypothetical protein